MAPKRFDLRLTSLHLLSIPSCPIKLADGLVRVVRVPVVHAAAEPQPGVGGGPRVPGLCKLKEARNLPNIHSTSHFDVEGIGEGKKTTCENGGCVIATARHGHHNAPNDRSLTIFDTSMTKNIAQHVVVQLLRYLV